MFWAKIRISFFFHLKINILTAVKSQYIAWTCLKSNGPFWFNSYNITGRRATGAEFHGTFEEHVVAIVELEDVEVNVVTFDQWDARFYIIKVATEYITVLTATKNIKDVSQVISDTKLLNMTRITIQISIGFNAPSLPVWHTVTFERFVLFHRHLQW